MTRGKVVIWAETAQADAADTASGFRPTSLGLAPTHPSEMNGVSFVPGPLITALGTGEIGL
jgi:hypothetical protein